MREIVLDTETTGLAFQGGDRLVEIGCVELINRFPTGRTYHVYVNPERDMPLEAFNVHGLSTEFLQSKPKFGEIVEEFLAFIADDPLVIHNAEFDLGFLNMELQKIGRRAMPVDRAVNTLILARRKHPGVSNRLDDLCSRYGVDNSKRTKHGALLDAELLAEVYAELVGGRQAALSLADFGRAGQRGGWAKQRQRPVPLLPRVTEADRAEHRAFIATLAQPALWDRYRENEPQAVPAAG